MISQDTGAEYQSANNNEGSLRDEISFKEILLGIINIGRYVLKQWKIILLVAVIGAGYNFYKANRQKLLYVATSTFVLQDGGGSSVPNDAFSSILGINEPQGGGMFQGDNLLELYRTRFMVKKVLLSKIEGSNDHVIDRYMKLNGIRPAWKADPRLRNFDFFKPVPKGNLKLARISDSVMTAFVNDIRYNYLNVDRDRRLNIFYVETRSPQEEFSWMLNNQVVKTVNEYYIQTKTQKTVNNLALMQHQADSIRAALNRAMYRTASSIDYSYNANPSMQVSKLPSQRSQIDAETDRSMLNELVRNIEMTKMSLRRETPLIQQLDEPVFPLEKRRESRAKAIIVGALIGAVLASVLCLLVYTYKKIADALKPSLAEPQK